MAQLSKRRINPIIDERLSEVLWSTLTKLRSPEEAEDFCRDLLSPTEIIMLKKRVGIALMLLKGESYEVISDTLKVSTTTVMSVNQWINGGSGGYQKIIDRIKNDEKLESLFLSIDEVLSKIFPPRRGTNWSNELSKRWHERTRRRKQIKNV